MGLSRLGCNTDRQREREARVSVFWSSAGGLAVSVVVVRAVHRRAKQAGKQPASDESRGSR